MKQHLERTLIWSKLIILKASYPLTWIYQTSSKKNVLYSAHIIADPIKWMVLKSPGKPPELTKHLNSMHLKGNTPIKHQKWWHALQSDFFNTSQKIATDALHRKHSKIQLIFSKHQLLIHPQYQYQMRNLIEYRKCIMSFTKIVLEKSLCPHANVKPNPQEISACSYIMFILLHIIEWIGNARTFPSYSFDMNKFH